MNCLLQTKSLVRFYCLESVHTTRLNAYITFVIIIFHVTNGVAFIDLRFMLWTVSYPGVPHDTVRTVFPPIQRRLDFHVYFSIFCLDFDLESQKTNKETGFATFENFTSVSPENTIFSSASTNSLLEAKKRTLPRRFPVVTDSTPVWFLIPTTAVFAIEGTA